MLTLSSTHRIACAWFASHVRTTSSTRKSPMIPMTCREWLALHALAADGLQAGREPLTVTHAKVELYAQQARSARCSERGDMTYEDMT